MSEHHSDWCLRCGHNHRHGPTGDLSGAIPLFEQTLSDTVRVLSEDHPDTLTARNNLACAYQSAGDLNQAIPLFEQTLSDTVRVLSEDHPDTLTARNNLAYAYQSAGDLNQAIPLFEQTLSDTVQVLGKVHPLTKAVRCAHVAACAQRAVDGPKMM
ncbi:tetratricopeptide repeat protein [Streptomyces atratus]|uniref:tetratricopeptide repeat protein n=1 Tax=Streptomyces atratus TaxID=1893 RepID=UPI003250B6E6